MVLSVRISIKHGKPVKILSTKTDLETGHTVAIKQVKKTC